MRRRWRGCCRLLTLPHLGGRLIMAAILLCALFVGVVWGARALGLVRTWEDA